MIIVIDIIGREAYSNNQAETDNAMVYHVRYTYRTH